MSALYDIQVRLESRRGGVTVRWARSTARKILKALGWKKAALSLFFVSDRKIRVINRKHLRHDWPTDVISFSQIEGRKSPAAAAPMMGDIVISLDTAARQAREWGNPFLYEVAFYLCHGILHLMGHDDGTPAKRNRMLNKQARLLRKIGIKK